MLFALLSWFDSINNVSFSS